jgi:hypothetical protein
VGEEQPLIQPEANLFSFIFPEGSVVQRVERWTPALLKGIFFLLLVVGVGTSFDILHTVPYQKCKSVQTL